MPIFLIILFCFGFIAADAPRTASVYLDAGPGGAVWNGRIYSYGRVAKTAEPFDGDAWLRIENEATGELVAAYVYDGGNDETFIYFAILGDAVFALVTETRGIPDSGGSTLRKTEIFTFTPDGERLGYAACDGLMAAYNNHGGMLILSEDENYLSDHVFDAGLAAAVLPETMSATGVFTYPYRAFALVDGVPVETVSLTEPGIYEVAVSDGSYTYRFLATVDPVINGIEAFGEYEDAVTITAKGTLRLDGEPFASGGTVAAPGIHELSVSGVNGYQKTVAFVIHPFVANVAEGFRTADAVRIFSNADELLIDGAAYAAGDVFRTPGNHVLTVRAANGYERTIAFAILPSVAGLEAGAVYPGGVTFIINGTAVLGGLSVTGEVAVTTPGTYELDLYFNGEPYSTTAFSVTEAPAPEHWWTAFPFLEVALGMLAVTGLFLIFRKK